MNIPNPTQQIVPPHRGIHIGISSSFLKGALLILAGGLVGGIIAYLVAASRFKAPDQKKSITVTATGSVDLKATEATISGYSNDYSKKYATQTEAETSAKNIADKAKLEILSTGVINAAMTVSSYATPDYKYDYIAPTPAPEGGVIPPSYQQSTTTGYYPSISITVALNAETISKADQVLSILDKYKLTSSATYYATPSDQVKAEARKNALLDARKQVDDLEEIGDIHVKNIISIKDASFDKSMYQDPYYQKSEKVYLDQGSTTAPYKVILEIVYELK